MKASLRKVAHQIREKMRSLYLFSHRNFPESRERKGGCLMVASPEVEGGRAPGSRAGKGVTREGEVVAKVVEETVDRVRVKQGGHNMDGIQVLTQEMQKDQEWETETLMEMFNAVAQRAVTVVFVEGQGAGGQWVEDLGALVEDAGADKAKGKDLGERCIKKNKSWETQS